MYRYLEANLGAAVLPKDEMQRLKQSQRLHKEELLPLDEVAQTLSAKDRAILGHTYGVFGYEKLSADELGLREMLSPAQPVSRQRSAPLAGCVSCTEGYFRYLTNILFLDRVFGIQKEKGQRNFLWPRWFIRADMKYLSAASVSKSSGASSMKQI